MSINKYEIFTIPNGMSVLGFALVADGIRRGVDTPLGVAELFTGRMIDIADGWAARKFNQESKFGKKLDATLDKLGMLAIIVAEKQRGIIPNEAAAGIITQNVVNIGATYVAHKRYPNRQLDSSLEGKHATLVQGLAVGSYATAAALENSHYARSAQLVRSAGNVLAYHGTLSIGAEASHGYLNRMK